MSDWGQIGVSAWPFASADQNADIPRLGSGCGLLGLGLARLGCQAANHW